MSNKTAAVKVQEPQLEEIQELNTMKESLESRPMEESQELSDLQQILTYLQDNHLSLAEVMEMKQMIEDLPEEFERRTKGLLKPTETKSETFLITKQNQEIAQEQLAIAKANTDMLAQSLKTQEQQSESLNHQTALLELLVTSNGLQMPSTELESSEN